MEAFTGPPLCTSDSWPVTSSNAKPYALPSFMFACTIAE